MIQKRELGSSTAIPAKQQRSWWFFLGLNAPAFSIAMIHVVNNPNLYHYALTHFIDLGLLERNRLNSALALLGVVGLLVAGVVQPTIGFLSDRTNSPLGSRYPYFLLGGLALFLSLLVLVQSSSWLQLLLAVGAAQVAINAMQSPMQALIPDHVDPIQKGPAASMKTILELLGIIASGVIIWMFLGDRTNPTWAVVASTGILFLSLLLSALAAPPRPNHQQRRPMLRPAQRYMRRYRQQVNSAYRRRLGLLRNDLHHILRQPGLRWWFLSRFLFYAAFNTLGKFAVNYLMDVYGYEGQQARAVQGILLVALGVIVFLAILATGVLSQRYQHRYLAALGGVIAALATLALIPVPALSVAAVMVGIIGVGCGIFMSAGWAMATNIVPLRFAAFYLGVANIATTLGGAFGMLGGFLVDSVNDYYANSNSGYQVLFMLLTLLFALGGLVALRVRPRREIRLQ